MYPPLQTVDPLFYKHAGTSTVYTSNTAREIQKIGAKHTRGIHFWLKFRVQTTRDGTILASFIYIQHLKLRNNLKQLTAEGDANQV